MTMENVSIPNDLKGYIYVFEATNDFVNDPIGSLQFKSFTDLEPIEVLEISYDNFENYYQNNDKNKIRGTR